VVLLIQCKVLRHNFGVIIDLLKDSIVYALTIPLPTQSQVLRNPSATLSLQAYKGLIYVFCGEVTLKAGCKLIDLPDSRGEHQVGICLL
jgi:hypothetical protein